MELRLLGPVEAVVGGASIELGSRMQRALLALLALDPGSRLSLDAIIDGLWDDPPESARATVQGYVYGLRRALEPSRERRGRASVLTSADGGYALRVAPDHVDACRVRRLAAEASDALRRRDLAAAEAAVHTALAEWDGEPLAGLGNPFARLARTSLDELKLSLEEHRADVELGLGRHGEVAARLGPLSAAVPLRESLRERLALALYRGGRQADAIAVLDDARRTLADELGLDLGVRLAELYASMLRQDPALDWSAAGTLVVVSPEGAGPPQPAVEPSAPPDARALVTASGDNQAPRGNLPAPVSSFIGRVREQEEVLAAVATGRLITLVGVGGVGKTRLAVQVAGRLQLDDGPWFIALAGLHDPSLLVSTIAATLGLVLPPGDSPADRLIALLSQRNTLLLLDNCEHVVGAVAELSAAVLQHCPGIRMLCTTRETLQVDGERLVEVRPMPHDADAVRLFEERTTALVRDWPVERERARVTEICARLDGLPLAIELAAAQTRHLSSTQILAHLDDRFQLLSTPVRGGLNPHGGLAAAVEWSTARLTPQERSLFTATWVFEGGFDLEAATWVHGDGAAVALRGLVTKSLLEVDRRDGAPRYRMLETLREYARRGVSGPELAALEQRHCAWIVDLTARAGAELRGFGAAQWLRSLDEEQPNIRRALTFSLTRGNPVDAARIAGSLAWAWWRRGQGDEGERWTVAALSACPAENGPARARLLVGLAALRFLAGRPDESLRLSNAALDADDERRPDVYGWAAIIAGYCAALLGDTDTAGRRGTEAVSLAMTADEPWLAAEGHHVLGHVARLSGDPVGAEGLLATSASLGDACGHRWIAGTARWTAAKLALDRGDPEAAVQLCSTALVQHAAEHDVPSTLVLGLTLACALAAAGDDDRAVRMLAAVRAHAARVGSSPETIDPVDTARQLALIDPLLEAEGAQRLIEDGAGWSWDVLVSAAAAVRRGGAGTPV